MIDNREEQLQRVANRLRKVVEDYSTQVRLKVEGDFELFFI